MRYSPFILFFVAALACGSDPAPAERVSSLYLVPASLESLDGEHFYDLPYPSDARLESDGTIRLLGFYNRYNNGFVRDLLVQGSHLMKGFSLAGAHYFRFTGAIADAELPADPPASLDPKSLVQIVDIDRASPEFGKRTPAMVTFREGGKEDVYYLPNTLSVMPALGSPLRPSTRYATVVRRGLHDRAGREVTRAHGLSALLGLEKASGAAEEAHVAAFSDVAGVLSELGLPPDEIVHLTVFRTSDPRAEVFALSDFTKKSFPPPVVRDGTWAQHEAVASFDVYEGTYGPSPIFQKGTPPYRDAGGDLAFDEKGTPVVQGTFDLRFALSVPNAAACPMPSAGYPVVLYAHGTGGDYRSVVAERSGVAENAGKRCMAAMGIDQIFHGTRPGAPDPNDPRAERDIELAFFNLLNMRAGRSNPGQSAIDIVQQARLFTVSKISVPASVSRTGAPVSFDGSNLTFMGHSQGGINGPLFLAADDQARGGVLSGTGAIFAVSLMDKTKPDPPIRGLVKAFTGLYTSETDAELNLLHPTLTMAQTMVEIGDPVSYMRTIVREPRPGFTPKSILQTEGVREDGTGDNFTPVRAIEAGSALMGLPVLAPVIHPLGSFPDPGSVTATKEGISGNIGGGLATGAVAQFRPGKRDGHFVVFEIPEASRMAGDFLRDLANEPKGRLRSP